MRHPGQVAHWSQDLFSIHYSKVRNYYKTMYCILCKFQGMGIKVTWMIIWNLSAGFILPIQNPWKRVWKGYRLLQIKGPCPHVKLRQYQSLFFWNSYQFWLNSNICSILQCLCSSSTRRLCLFKGFSQHPLYAFDLTPKMLAGYRITKHKRRRSTCVPKLETKNNEPFNHFLLC